MKKSEAQKLHHGLYVIHWKKKSGGGSSMASVGSDRSGNRWMAPCNWVSGSSSERSAWKAVEKVELIAV